MSDPRKRQGSQGSGVRQARGTDTSQSTPRPIPGWRRRLYRIPLLGAIVYLIWPVRTRPPSIARRAASWVAVVVAIFGLGMVGYPQAGEHYPAFYRVPVERLIEWSNVLSDMETNRIQTRLEDEFVAMEDPTQARDGDPLTRLEIPSIGVDTIVVSGTSPEALKAGAGHYPQTPLPGEIGNVAIAGHRTTYGRPFNKIDALKPGDEIVLTTPAGRFVYHVAGDPWVTDPFDWSVIDPTQEAALTLTTCHPRGSDRQRLIVRAVLAGEGSEPSEGRPTAAADVQVPGGDAGGLSTLQLVAAGAGVTALLGAIAFLPRRRRDGSPD